MVERISRGANRSTGGQSGCATSQLRGPYCETDSVAPRDREYTSKRITGLVDLTDQFDANHSFAIYTPGYSALGFLCSIRNATWGKRLSRHCLRRFPIVDRCLDVPRSFPVVVSANERLEISERIDYIGPSSHAGGEGPIARLERSTRGTREETVGHGMIVGILATHHDHLADLTCSIDVLIPWNR